MKYDAVQAIETRLAWLRWAERNMPALSKFGSTIGYGRHGDIEPGYTPYVDILETSETFCMTARFAQLVSHAAAEIPGDLRYDTRWLIAPRGWMFLCEPIVVGIPRPRHCFYCRRSFVSQAPQVSCADKELLLSDPQSTGWRKVDVCSYACAAVLNVDMDEVDRVRAQFEPVSYLPAGLYAREGATRDMGALFDGLRVRAVGWRPIHASVEFRFYVAREGGEDFSHVIAPGGFAPWTRIVLRDGLPLAECLAASMWATTEVVTSPGGSIGNARWLYAALHLMAQRVALRVEHPIDRGERRRIEQSGRAAIPSVQIITLRRLEEDRRRDPTGNDVDWQWQWLVTGHWRNQFYPSENIHKPVFIEAYSKGPSDKPWKPGTMKLYKADR